MGEDFFSGSGILIITKSGIDTPLHVWKISKEMSINYEFFLLHLSVSQQTENLHQLLIEVQNLCDNP